MDGPFWGVQVHYAERVHFFDNPWRIHGRWLTMSWVSLRNCAFTLVLGSLRSREHLVYVLCLKYCHFFVSYLKCLLNLPGTEYTDFCPLLLGSSKLPLPVWQNMSYFESLSCASALVYMVAMVGLNYFHFSVHCLKCLLPLPGWQNTLNSCLSLATIFSRDTIGRDTNCFCNIVISGLLICSLLIETGASTSCCLFRKPNTHCCDLRYQSYRVRQINASQEKERKWPTA